MNLLKGALVMPEMTDEQLDEAIKAMGQKVTEENRKSMREMMNMSMDVCKGHENDRLLYGDSCEDIIP